MTRSPNGSGWEQREEVVRVGVGRGRGGGGIRHYDSLRKSTSQMQWQSGFTILFQPQRLEDFATADFSALVAKLRHNFIWLRPALPSKECVRAKGN